MGHSGCSQSAQKGRKQSRSSELSRCIGGAVATGFLHWALAGTGNHRHSSATFINSSVLANRPLAELAAPLAVPRWQRQGTSSGNARVACLQRGHRQRHSRTSHTGRHVFGELAALAPIASLAYAWLSKPFNAPGPSELLVARERRARIAVKKAKSKPTGPERDEELRRAEAALAEVAEVLRSSYADLEQYPVPQFLDSCYGMGTINLAVTGASGVGKSSFINAIRRLSARDPAAAKTGVTETTFEPQMFTFDPGRAGIVRKAFDGVGKFLRRLTLDDDSENPIRAGDRLMLQGLSKDVNGQIAEVVSAAGWESQIVVKVNDGRTLKVSRDNVASVLADCVVWDLPGVGTASFPQATYLSQMGIRHFDLVVLLTASRFTEAELSLMEELRCWKVPYFLVRSKIDFDIEAEIEDRGEDCDISDGTAIHIEEQTIDSIKAFFRETHGQEKIYCMSARPKFRSRFDFLELEADMQDAIRAQRVIDENSLNPLAQLMGA